MLTITKPILGLLLMATAAFGQPGTSYVLGDAGVNACPSGATPFADAAACKAAYDLGNPSYGTAFSFPDGNGLVQPFSMGHANKGCFITTAQAGQHTPANRMWFNTHATGSVNQNFPIVTVCLPVSNPTPGPTADPTPGPTTNPTPPPTSPPTPGPTASPTLEPVKVAAAAFDEVVTNVSAKHCYNGTDAARVDMKELKSKFESYRMEILNVNRTDMMGGAKKALKAEFKKKQRTFAAVKRDIRTLKRDAKLNGKKGCDAGSPV